MKSPLDPASAPAIGRRLMLLRRAKGLTQTQLARLVGVTSQALNNYEQGRRKISHEPAIKMCNTIGASLDWIYRDIATNMPSELLTKIRALEKALDRDD